MEHNHNNLSTEKIEETLIELGYSLTDRGKYWHSNAVYRNGDNTTALQIWKDTGVWRDFVQGSQPMPFIKLLELHFGSNDKESLKKYLSDEYVNAPNKNYINEDKLTTDKIYPEEILQDLLPHYDFYHKKGIGVPNLKSLKGGLATKGEMYQRFVFPIYNEYGQIHGYCNCLVTFGLDISSKLLCHLISLGLDRIIISFNNDFDKPENRGARAAVKNYLKLLNHFDFQDLFICLPIKTDFGEMNAQDFDEWSEKCGSDIKDRAKQILGFAKQLKKEGALPKNLSSSIKTLEQHV